MAADYAEEQWDAVDHSDEPRLSGSDLTVAVDPDDVGELLERLCGPEVGEENYSEDEEPEMDEPETESDESVRWTKRGSSMLGGSVRSRSLTSVYDGDPVVSPSYPPLSPHLFVLECLGVESNYRQKSTYCPRGPPFAVHLKFESSVRFFGGFRIILESFDPKFAFGA
ncbi:hypothetical protein B0H13DRAFT_1886380 [Mycena leptocephala]|nr:hypothetical protein B0H13DRAFT_1886380 [Mycena leptocephala]